MNEVRQALRIYCKAFLRRINEFEYKSKDVRLTLLNTLRRNVSLRVNGTSPCIRIIAYGKLKVNFAKYFIKYKKGFANILQGLLF